MTMTSPAFSHDAMMPRRYTAEGDDLSPPLSWTGVPDGARSLALIVEDIDIPIPRFLLKSWVHWVVYDIPPERRGFPEGVPRSAAVAGGGTQGRTSWLRPGWGGPNPVGGAHRYVFKLFALDCILAVAPRSASKSKLLSLMQGHVLASAELTGRYEKQGR
ncbi:MAG TPA: YbhB/YbcL family Raf kinase inhibitor-like protein [Spirochaetia bacterium]|nr:YbhB/YbcL family Raf kinase inhibitor-like protein [Spirochaetia bacterium]